MKIEITSGYLDTRIEIHDPFLSLEAEEDISKAVINLRKEILDIIEMYKEPKKEREKFDHTLNIPDIHDALETQRVAHAVKEFPELKYDSEQKLLNVDENQDDVEKALDGIENETMSDTAGIPWDKRIHASTRIKNDDGTWRKKRGVSAALIKKVEAEIVSVFAVPNPPANVTLVAPAPPATAIVPPPVEIIDTPVKLQQYISRVTAEELITYSDVVDALKEFGLNSTAELFTPGNEAFTSLVYAKIKSYIP